MKTNDNLTLIKMKSFKSKLLLVAIMIAANFCNAQTPYECGGSGAPTSATRTVGCMPSQVPYTSKYGRIAWHVPTSLTPVKTINISFHFIQDANGNNNWIDDQAHRDRVNAIVAAMNARMASLYPPSDPISGVTSLTDTKIRYELTGIYFYKNSYLNNLILTRGEGYKYNDYLNSINPSRIKSSIPIYVTKGAYTDNDKASAFCDLFPSESNLTQNSAIISFGGYDDPGKDSPLAMLLIHEFGHAMDLYHTFELPQYKLGADYLSDVYNTTWWNYCNPPTNYACAHEKDGDPFDNNRHTTNNIMGNSVIAGYLSPLQIGTMHRALALKSVRKYVKEMNSSVNNLVVNQNEIWDFDIQLYQNMLVTNGATVNLICKVAMANNAIIKVDPGATLVVSGSLLSSWGSMWSGIVLYPGSRLIVQNGATIENALLAVDSKGGAPFTIDDSKLNRNYKGVWMEPFAGTHPGVIRNTIISCLDNNGNPTNLVLSPKAGIPAYSGIEISNVTQASVGTDLYNKTNTFDNLEMGIISTNSNLTAYNNNFNRIKWVTNTQLGRAIYATNSDVPTAERTLIVGGNANIYQKNTFTNCYMGAYANLNQDVSIVSNKFTNITHTAAYVLSCGAAGNSVSILNNTLDDCQRAIFLSGSKGSSYVEVSNNSINATGSAKPNGIGISISDVSLSTSGTAPTMNVLNNNIQRVALGIEVTNYTMPTVRNNTLTNLSDLGSSTSTNGILVTTCPSANVESNLVKGPSAASQNSWWMAGIRFESSANTKVIYNGIEDIGRGLFFSGSNAGTQVAKNNMKNNYNGLILNFGMIGYQLGSPGACKATENTWQGSVPAGGSNLFSYYSDGTQSAMNLLSTTNPAWIVDMKTPGNIVSSVAGGSTAYLVSIYTCNTTSGYTGGHRKGAEIHNIAHDQLIKLAKDEINFPVLDASAKWWAKYNLYNQLQSDLKLQEEEPELKTFSDIYKAGNLGKLYQLNESINKNDWSTASALSNGFVSKNTIEQNLKDVYLISIINQKNNAFDPAAIKKLQAIAKLCPYESGPAVYNARALLARVDDVIYSNSCEMPTPESKSRGVVSNTNENLFFTEAESISVYPNPSNEKLNVYIPLEKGQTGMLLIFDLAGKLIKAMSLTSGNDISEISTAELNEGIYTYRLIVGNANVKSGKLSIIH